MTLMMLKSELLIIIFFHATILNTQSVHRYRSKPASNYYYYYNKQLVNDPCNLIKRSLPINNRGFIVICLPDVGSLNNDRRQLQSTTTVVPIYEKNDDDDNVSLPKSLDYRQPRSYAVARQEIPNVDAEYTIHPKYSYNYGVLDGSTGDTKAAWEERNGDSVRGEYTVVDPDGTLRTVTYTADDKNGFKAVITKKNNKNIHQESEDISKITTSENTTPTLQPVIFHESSNNYYKQHKLKRLRYPNRYYDQSRL